MRVDVMVFILRLLLNHDDVTSKPLHKEERLLSILSLIK